MNNITFIIPTYNPNLLDLKKSVESALKVEGAQLIFVDDKSTDESHFNYLNKLDELDNVTLYFNKKNLGPFWNSVYAYTLPTTTWCKKLDPDDEVNPKSYNSFTFNKSNSMYITGYKYKNKKMNRKLHKNIGHIFNGACIYKTNEIKKYCNEIQNKNLKFNKWFEDQLLPYMFILDNKKISWNEDIFYLYKELATSRPKHFRKSYELWMSDYSEMDKFLNEKFGKLNINDDWTNKMFERNYEKQMIFANLLSLCVKNEDNYFDRLTKPPYKNTPRWLRKVISKIVMMF